MRGESPAHHMTFAINTPVIHSPIPLVVDSAHAFNELMKLDWQRTSPARDEYFVNRLWLPYSYSTGESVRQYAPMVSSPMIDLIWGVVESELGVRFDMCFLNRYRDGLDSIGWHSDDNLSNDVSRPIVIVSFGAERIMEFRRKGEIDAGIMTRLQDNRMVIMPEFSQFHWEHRIPKEAFISAPRISMTFRGFNT